MANFNALEALFLTNFGPQLELNRQGSTTGNPTGLPSLEKDSFIETWIPEMESDFAACAIPNGDWTYGGMVYFPEGFLKSIMIEGRRKIREQTGAEWTWDDYKAEVVEVFDNIALLKRIGTIGSGVVLGLTVGPPLIVGGLAVLGFGTAGVGAGSAAALMQSIVYRGATGGLFSVCQSVGATGVVGAAGTAFAGAAVGTVAGFFSRRR